MRILPHATAASVGLDPAALDTLVARLDALGTVHAFVLVRDGAIVGEGAWAPHTLDRPHQLFSVSKSFTATAVGLAIDEGLFDLDSRVVDLLAADAPASVSDHLAALRVRHLLTMSTGHAVDTMNYVRTAIGRDDGDWPRQILALPVEHEPGWPFIYDTDATYLAGVIVQRLTGQRLLDYLRPRLFEPLGITTATWEQDPDGLDVGGFGLSLTVTELAAFGQLYLQRGQWNDAQLVPTAWVDAATSKQIDNSGRGSGADWEQGYGYQFWRCRHGAYRADGAFGQFCVVWPEHQLVLAINAGTSDMGSILDAVWDSLPVPAVPTAAPAHLVLPTPAGAPSSPRAASIDGVPLRLNTGDTLTVGASAFWQVSADVATAGAWVDDSTLVVRRAILGTPVEETVTLHVPEAGPVAVSIDHNVSFSDTHILDALAAPMTLFEAAGGIDGLTRLAQAWHERVLADEVVSHAFHNGVKPDHAQRLAAYWAQALGGPAAYSSTYGDETSVVALHSGNGVHTEMDDRAIACFDAALDEVGLTLPRLRAALHDYFADATRGAMARYHASAADVPAGLSIPTWTWSSVA